MNLLRQHFLEPFFAALRFFTRLPVPAWVGHDAESLNRAAPFFPAIGLVVGLASAITFMLASAFWPKTIAVLLAMGLTIYLTGAFHEDGLSDMVDGIGGGWTQARILEIMKDSRVGSFGVVALVMVLLGKFMALVELAQYLIPAALVAGHTVSRFASTCLLYTMDYVREDAASKSKPLATRLSWSGLMVSGGFALFSLLWVFALSPARTVLACILVALTTAWFARLLQRNLGGYTGDCLGATQQGTEVAFYLGLLLSFQGKGV